MNDRSISPGFVEDAVECLVRRGIDPNALLATAGIAATTDTPGEPVTHLQYGRLWLAIAERIGDEFFGQAARPMRPGSFVLMGHAVLHAGTLEHALRRALRFLGVVLDDPIGVLRQRDSQAEIVLSDAHGPRSAFTYRTYWVLLLGLMCWLIGRRIPLSRVDFACPAPPNRQEHYQFFGAPVHFDQPHSQVSFAAQHLSLPTIRDERELKSFMRAAPANLLFGYRHDQGMSSSIRKHLRATDPTDWPNFEALATRLGLSAGTLRRRLRGEGQSYSAIRDELRQALARQWLGGSELTISQIALRLGYAEPSAFHRAFLKWAGRSPASWRRNAATLASKRPASPSV